MSYASPFVGELKACVISSVNLDCIAIEFLLTSRDQLFNFYQLMQCKAEVHGMERKYKI